MRDDILEIILYYSKFDPLSNSARRYARENGFSIKTVCIDNPEIRKRVSQCGNYFNITNPTTLQVVLTDGGIKLYEGEKSIEWMYSQVMKKYSNANPQGQSVHSTSIQPSRTPPPPQPSEPINSNYTNLEGEETSYPEATPLEQLQTEVSGLKFSNDPSSLTAPKKDNNATDIKEIAKKMQMEREQGLGYNEAELPYN